VTDDIVTRLREYVATEGDIEWHFIMLDAADEIESLRFAYKQAIATIEGVAEEVRELREAGDALAATGGQHGFDEALDNWKQLRGG
jgi:hypothetical protein